jgi:hypothetical protein
MKYTFAPRVGISLDRSTIFLYLNGTKIDERLAINYDWNNITVSNITIQTANESQLLSSVELKICGDPRLGGMGNILSFFSLKKSGDIKIIKKN